MSEREPTQVYPGGDADERYETTLYAGAVIFLMTVCFGLMNFLGQYIKHM